MTLTPLLTGSLLVSGGGLALALYFSCLALLRGAREPGLLAGFLTVAAARVLVPVFTGLGGAVSQIGDDVLLRFDGISLLLMGVTYVLFLRSLFPEDVPHRLVLGAVWGSLAASGLILLAPADALNDMLDWSRALMMLVLLAVGALSILLMRRWRDGAGWVALSVLALVLAILVEGVLWNGDGVIPRSIPCRVGPIAVGGLLFAVGHVFLMGARLNRVYQASQTLSRHVVALNRRLEQRVTEASQEIHATREQLEAILSCVPDGVLTLTVDARIDIFGPGAERMFGWRSQEMAGRSAVDLLSPEWGERLVRSMRRFATEGVLTYSGQGPVAMEGRRRDGSIFPMQTTVTRIDIGGQTVFVVAIRDTSEEQQQKQHLETLQASCDVFRQDLSLIEAWGGVGHFIAEYAAGRESCRWSEGFLTVWGVDPDVHPGTLAGFLAGVRPEDQAEVFEWLDRRDWTSGSRLVRVCVSPEEERSIELSVRRFRNDAGDLVREIGIVRLVGVAGAGKGDDGMETAAVGTEGVRSILLVEDVEVNRRVAITFLEREGYQVDVASNGLDAVEMAGRGNYDLILMDIRLPDVDGVEATRRIRALPDPVRSSVPVLALTANVFGDDLTRYEAAGMSGVVAKPIRMPQFRTVLGGVLTRRRQQAAVAEGPDWTSLEQVLDEGFITDRRAVLGAESFGVILDLGRRSAGFAAEELGRCAMADPVSGPDLAKAGHKLAGAASNFGFAALYALGRQVEALCESGKPAEAAVLGQQAPDLLRQTDEALTRWLQGVS